MSVRFRSAKALGMAAALFGLVGLFPAAAQAACSTALSDAEAGPVVEQIENTSFDTIPLGELRVDPFKRQFLASDGTDYGWDEFQAARAAALAGFVTARREDNGTPINTLEDWRRITTDAGRTTNLLFGPTDLGRRISGLTGLDSKSRYLYVFNGTAHVEAVLQNRAFASGASEYRVVQGLVMVSNIPPEWQSYRKAYANVMRADGTPPEPWYAGTWSNEVELSILLVLDVSACKWVAQTWDYAFRGQAFTTNNVGQAVKDIQSVSP